MSLQTTKESAVEQRTETPDLLRDDVYDVSRQRIVSWREFRARADVNLRQAMQEFGCAAAGPRIW